MKEVGIKLVALFEIIFGLAGLNLVLAVVLGWVPYGALPTVWYGVFPAMSLVAGILILLRWKYAYQFSLALLWLQVPFIRTDEFLLNLGGPFNFTIKGVWLSQHGGGPTVLGINLLALAVAIILWKCRPSFETQSVVPSDLVESPKEASLEEMAEE